MAGNRVSKELNGGRKTVVLNLPHHGQVLVKIGDGSLLTFTPGRDTTDVILRDFQGIKGWSIAHTLIFEAQPPTSTDDQTPAAEEPSGDQNNQDDQSVLVVPAGTIIQAARGSSWTASQTTQSKLGK